MAELQIDPFVSTEPDVELDEETLQLLDERVADPAPLITGAEARKRFTENPIGFSKTREWSASDLTLW